MTRTRNNVFIVAVLAMLCACSAPDKPSASVPAVTMPAQYLIGPGDELEVFVWGNQELSVTVPVRPDGRISTPLVEDMQAVGNTPTQLARDMEAGGRPLPTPQQARVTATTRISP